MKETILLKTSTAAEDPRYLKVEVGEKYFSDCSYVMNRTCYSPMFIM